MGQMRVKVTVWEADGSLVDEQDEYLSDLQAAEVRLICQIKGRVDGAGGFLRPAVALLGLLSVGTDVTLKEYGAAQLRARLKPMHDHLKGVKKHG
jgi:hypothetical protein